MEMTLHIRFFFFFCFFSSFILIHCKLNELPFTEYWKILTSILGMSGYVIKEFPEKNGL